MNAKKLKYMVISVAFLAVATTSCKKFLDVKSQQILQVPASLDDVQTLLNNQTTLNENSSPYLSEVYSDNYYITTTSFNALSVQNKQMHIWDKDFQETTTSGWQTAYTGSIYIANNALDIIERIKETPQNRLQRNSLIGQALFFRSYIFERLAQIYCMPYTNNASNDLGLVLKLNSDIGEKTNRASLEKTYEQILEDLKKSSELLPETANYATQPTRCAAFALLARTYLSMRDYVNAGKYADLSLKIKSRILDFNTLIPVKSPPFQIYNDEVIFHSRAVPATCLSVSNAKIDPSLYQSYSANDLRKSMFFLENNSPNQGTYQFRGSYQGTFGPSFVFDGLTTAEMLLTRAECYARAGDKDAALADLNALMIKRWNNSNNSWNPISANTADEAKKIILNERRKELVFRNLRWSDIRRLNVEGAGITLERNIGGITYTLPPNDRRMATLLPAPVVNIGGLVQNPR